MWNYKRTVSSRRKWCELLSWLAFRNSGNVFQWSCNPKDRQERQCGHVYNVRTVNIDPKAANLILVSFSMKQSMYKFNGWGDFIICCSWVVSRVDSPNPNCQSFHLHFICMTWRGHDIFYLYLNINTHSLSMGAAYSQIYLWFIPNFLVVIIYGGLCSQMLPVTDIKQVELHFHFCGRMHLSLRTKKCLTQLNIFKILTINWLVHNSFHTIHL